VKLALVSALLVLAGCESAEQRHAREAFECSLVSEVERCLEARYHWSLDAARAQTLEEMARRSRER